MDAQADLRPCVPSDFSALVDNVRDIDRLEWEAMTGQAMTAEGVSDLAKLSRSVRTLTWGGRVVAVMGVHTTTLLSDTGAIWFLATKVAKDRAFRRAFVRHSHWGLIELAKGFRLVWNAVASENRDAIRWLAWLGFRFDDHSVQTIRGVEFRPFYREMR